MDHGERRHEEFHRGAAMRMAQYDKLSPAMRLFVQQNDHLFVDSTFRKYKVQQLMKLRKNQGQKWCTLIYGEEHPNAYIGKIQVKKERSSQ
jgi:hypothetical protein